MRRSFSDDNEVWKNVAPLNGGVVASRSRRIGAVCCREYGESASIPSSWRAGLLTSARAVLVSCVRLVGIACRSRTLSSLFESFFSRLDSHFFPRC